MATFSILTRDGDRAPSRILAPHPQLTSSGEVTATREPAAKPVGDPAEHLAPPPPRLAIQLPDLALLESDSTPARHRFSIGSVLYWVGIALGTALAVTLIWTPHREPIQPMNDAPSWTPPSSTRGEELAPPHGRFGASFGPGAAPQREASEAPIMQSVDPHSEQAPSSETAPALEGRLIQNGVPRQSPAYPCAPQHVATSPAGPPEIRTASGPGARWDGSSNHVRPSEAAPLGITTPVQQ